MQILRDDQSESLRGGSLINLPAINTNVDVNLINQLQNAATIGLLGGTANTGQLQAGGILNLPRVRRR